MLVTQGSNGSSFGVSLSADGRYINFYSDAINLVAGCTTSGTDVYQATNPFLHNTTGANGDFNADGLADLMWQKPDGTLLLDKNNGDGGYVQEFAGSLPASIRFIDTGDFNGDARADLLWRMDSGESIIAQTRETAGYDLKSVTGPDGYFKAIAAADFNGDGWGDIL